MKHHPLFLSLMVLLLAGCGSSTPEAPPVILDLQGAHPAEVGAIWLSHEHLLVDFIGAEAIDPDTWNHESILAALKPYLDELREYSVKYFVDATPAYLGRDVQLLQKIAAETGLTLLTNTGLYGAVNNRYIPAYAFEMSAEELAGRWTAEFENGIEGSTVRPGFIKIGVESRDPLMPFHETLAEAAALTHLRTGMVIASHTGRAEGMWPQLDILKKAGVSPEAFIWVHAQQEDDHDHYLKAAEEGVWISLDGAGWDTQSHIEKLWFAKQHGILDRILISHDAGWYDPQKEQQEIVPYTALFKEVIPALMELGFEEEEIMQLMSVNPQRAFGIEVKSIHPPDRVH